jgi:hypothetical protein
MKVICIDNSPNRYGTADELIEGNPYTVIREFNVKGVIVYELLEFPSPSPMHGFSAYRFVPTSSIDETNFERNYETVKI